MYDDQRLRVKGLTTAILILLKNILVIVINRTMVHQIWVHPHVLRGRLYSCWRSKEAIKREGSLASEMDAYGKNECA